MQKVLFVTPATAKPFLKWAGGKTQLLEQIKAYFPAELARREIRKYVEPFLGGGAVFFYIAQTFKISEFYLFDRNEELVLAYNTIKRDVENLIERLCELQSEYQERQATDREEYFYAIRQEFNTQLPSIDFEHFSKAWVERTAQLIFLNRTCFNGLFRVNPRGAFNVPFGRYSNPQICNPDNLREVSRVLQDATIKHGDFTDCKSVVTAKTFVYFDPPYRPISTTSSFTSYSKHYFGDEEQRRLAEFYRKLDAKGAKLMLSNSDPKNENAQDHFFEKLYAGFKIKRVEASRMINADATKRGKIKELLIMNYLP